MMTFNLIKFGKKEHLQALKDRGQMRFGSVGSFHDSTDPGRGDSYEGCSQIFQGNQVEVIWGDLSLGEGLIDARIYPTDRRREGIFSAYAITEENFDGKIFSIDPRMFERYGPAALVIELADFIEKIKKIPQARYGLVSYEDLSLRHGPVSPFIKDQTHAYESEFRVLVPGKASSESAQFFEIGKLNSDWLEK